MGLLRLGLALAVLIYHSGYGGLGGPIAVYGFYVVSGFLISRVFLEQYGKAKGGVLVFYWNRALRIVPLFVLTSLLTHLTLLWECGSTTFDCRATLANGLHYLTSRTFVLSDFWNGVKPNVVVKGMPVPQVVAFFGWLPQFWTISIEFAFYLLAPLVLLARAKLGPKVVYGFVALTSLAEAAYVWTTGGAAFDRFNDIVYRNAIPSMFFFAAGMALYELHLVVRKRVAPQLVLVSTAIVLGLIVSGTKHLVFGPPVYAFMVWQLVAMAGVVPVVFSRPLTGLAGKLDNVCSNLSYGVYLNQSITLIFYFEYRSRSGNVDYVNSSFWHYLSVVAGTVALSWVTFTFVENPLNRMRSVFKQRFGIEGGATTSEGSPAAAGKRLVPSLSGTAGEDARVADRTER